MIDEKIINKGIVEIAVENIQAVDHEEYALLRKDYFGASDSSILCNVNLYKDLPALLKEKNNKFITEEEKAVGEKPIVRKGYDLEPIILDKAEKELGVTVHKPRNMYKFKGTKCLSVNYDGVTEIEDTLIPVEAKLVSKYGEKYYNKNVKPETVKEFGIIDKPMRPTLEGHIKYMALVCGIPPYYYTQVQQEIAGLDAPYGRLAALFDESWTFKLFLVPKDTYVIENIKRIADLEADKIKRDTI